MKAYRVFISIIMITFSMCNLRAQEQHVPANAAITTATATYKNNILRLAPISAMDLGVGFGMSYERLLGKNKKIGIILPAHIILENKSNSDNLYDTEERSFNTYLYLTPGIKFYPSGHNKVTYAIGPSLMLGISNNRTEQTTGNNYLSQTVQTVKYRRIRMGVIMNNYVTINISPCFDLGLEGGLGFCHYDKESFSSGSDFYPNSNNQATVDLTGQFSLSLGFKF